KDLRIGFVAGGEADPDRRAALDDMGVREDEPLLRDDDARPCSPPLHRLDDEAAIAEDRDVLDLADLYADDTLKGRGTLRRQGVGIRIAAARPEQGERQGQEN